jgi:hypothetical protein
VDDAHDGPYAREPQIEDLVRICRALNDANARYILIGGFAVIVHGGARTTKDIDLRVDASPENIVRVKQALRILEDHAVDDADPHKEHRPPVRIRHSDVRQYCRTTCSFSPSRRARPFRSISSIMKATPLTVPPNCLTRLTAALAVPPVASKSSTTSTR